MNEKSKVKMKSNISEEREREREGERERGGGGQLTRAADGSPWDGGGVLEEAGVPEEAGQSCTRHLAQLRNRLLIETGVPV